MGTKPTRLLPVDCLALWMLLFGSLCFGQVAHPIIVRVLNGKDSTPIAGQIVIMHLRVGKASGDEHDIIVHYQTDSHGEVQILSELAPENLDVMVSLQGNNLHCPRHVLVKTSTVIREGLMVASHGRGLNSSTIQAAPGEIVFVARPLSALEKVVYGY